MKERLREGDSSTRGVVLFDSIIIIDLAAKKKERYARILISRETM